MQDMAEAQRAAGVMLYDAGIDSGLQCRCDIGNRNARQFGKHCGFKHSSDDRSPGKQVAGGVRQ